MDGSRYALVVANDQYADPGLRRLVAPAQDAAALAEVLADPSVGGFEVRVLRNEPAQSIRLAVEDFFADRAPQDLLLLHFSGHGLKNAAGELFLAVADTRPTRLASTAVAADFVNRQMADSRAQRIALFLDCCYGGAFPRGMVVRAAGEAQVGDAFARQKTVGGGRGRAVVTASSAMEYAFEGGQLATGARPSPSVFTSAVVDGLSTGEADRDGDGWVGLTELVSYVTDRVHRVTPNQNPQMWTFGAQGELLIARSRVRRITPTPLPPELVEAMDSPLTATRFGVVDDLRERLHGADLGQAYAAYQALQRLADDDSRKVSEAARRWIASAAPQVSPATLDLGSVVLGGTARGEFRLGGPPLALTATASAAAPWIRVDQAGAAVQVTAEPTEAGAAEGTVVLQGPAGEGSVPVRLEVVPAEPLAAEPLAAEPMVGAASVAAPEPMSVAAAEPTPTAAEPTPAAAEPTPAAAEPTPAAVEPIPLATPEREPAPEPLAEPRPVVAAPVSEPTGRVPRWSPVALAIGAIILVVLNWPGADGSRYAWLDTGSGWNIYRSPTDPYIVAALVALVGALLTPVLGQRARFALGVVAGASAFLTAAGAVFLAGQIADDQAIPWAATAVIAAGMAGTAFAVAKPDLRQAPSVRWPHVVLVVSGVLLLVASLIVTDEGTSFLAASKGAAVLAPLAVGTLAWLGIASANSATRSLFGTAAGTATVLGVVDSVQTLANDIVWPAIIGLVGNALVLIVVTMAARRSALDTDQGPAEQQAHVGAIWRAWAPPIGLATCALLLLYVNGLALSEQEKLWHQPQEVIREPYDGTVFAALVAVVAALFTRSAGRVAAYALGVVAGVATLFITGAAVVLGGELGYYGTVTTWRASLVLAAVLLAGVAVALGRRQPRPRFGRPKVLPTALLGVGLVVLVGIQFVTTDGSTPAASYVKSVLLLPVVPAVLAALVLTLTDSDARRAAIGAAVAYSLLLGLASLYPIYVDLSRDFFVGMLAGHLVMVAAVAADMAVRRRRTPPRAVAAER
ncbi:MAG TPA: caspase family protein [Pseudonocardiaceae bacterium]